MQVTQIVERHTEYNLSFRHDEGYGFSFNCDVEGNIVPRDSEPRLNIWAWANLNDAIAGYCDGEFSLSIEDFSRDLRHYETICECGESLIAYGGYDEFRCDKCGAEYNIFGQRLRSNWRNNRSLYDDEIGDMEGYELGELAYEMEDY